LPNLAYIGGGGELAYWMELKKMFEHYKVPYPLLVLRNSFLLVESNTVKRIEKLPFDVTDFFKSKQQLLETLLLSSGTKSYEFSKELQQLDEFYDSVASKAETSDSTLKLHVAALKKQALNKLEGLAKKVKRKEKQRLELENKWIDEIRNELFPGGSLQERHESVLYYYAKYGNELLDLLYEHSLSLQNKFTCLQMKD
jgi:uncharacterized protein YllA (UPF0747 family)